MPNTSLSVPVLTDIHDTLLISAEMETWAWTTWAAQHDLDPEPFISTHGLRPDEKLTRFAPHLPLADELSRIAALASQCPRPIKAYPGAARLLRTTPKIAGVTSGTRAVVLDQLRSAGLPVPRVLVGGDDVTRGKPDPEPFLKAARLLGVPPTACLVLDDATPGVVAGVAAGMTVIAVATTTNPAVLLTAGARLVVADVAAFLKLRNAGSLPLPAGGSEYAACREDDRLVCGDTKGRGRERASEDPSWGHERPRTRAGLGGSLSEWRRGPGSAPAQQPRSRRPAPPRRA